MKANDQITAYYEKHKITWKTSTMTFYLNILNDLKKCFLSLNVTNLKRIDQNTFFDIVKWYKENTKHNNCQINRHIKFLRSVMHYYDIHTSFHKVKLLKNDSIPFQRFYDDDIEFILAYFRSYTYYRNSFVYCALVHFLLDSGARLSEALSIKIQDIDFYSMPMRVLLTNTKTGVIRYCPFSDFSLPYIKKVISLNPDEYLFYNFSSNRPMNRNDIKNIFYKAKKKLCIPRLTAHMFRKTFASQLIENGMPIHELQKLFGHSRLETTMIYVQTDNLSGLKSYQKYNKKTL